MHKTLIQLILFLILILIIFFISNKYFYIEDSIKEAKNNSNLKIEKNNSLNNKLISHTSNLDAGEVVYKLRPKNNDTLLKEIKSIEGINEASLLMY